MNRIQQNQKSMFSAVHDSFKTYSTILDTNPAMTSARNVFGTMLEELEQVEMIQSGHAVGHAELKQKEEAEMIQATVQIAAILYVYALDKDLPDLQKKASVSPSMLKRMSSGALKTACLNILQLAEQHKEVFVDYGSKPEKVDELKKEIDDFVAVISAPRSAIVTRSQATQRMKEIFSDINHLLKNKIDKLMLLFEHSHAEAYQNYKAARIIVDLHKGNKQEVEEEELEQE